MESHGRRLILAVLLRKFCVQEEANQEAP